MTQTNELYDPNALLNLLTEKLNVKNDAGLAKALALKPPIISKIRNRRSPITAAILVRMHEASDMSIKELRMHMGQDCDTQKFFIPPSIGTKNFSNTEHA